MLKFTYFKMTFNEPLICFDLQFLQEIPSNLIRYFWIRLERNAPRLD